MSRNLLLTGATGFVGTAVAQRLLGGDTPYRLRVAVRTASPIFPPEVRVERIDDVGPHTDWSACVQDVEVVIHCAARVHVLNDGAIDSVAEYHRINVAGTLALARQAAQACVRRFIFVSTIKVNGERTAPGQKFHADDVAAPQDAYAISKCEAEQGVLAIAQESGMEVVIIRPPLVYGPGVKGNFATLLDWLRRGMPLPLGRISNRRSLVALDNLVDFIALCAEPTRSPSAANHVFLVSDGDDVSTRTLVERMARAYGVKARLLPIPTWWLRFAATPFGKTAVVDRLSESLVVDSSKARQMLGWLPVVTMDQQLRKMAEHDQHT